MPFASPWFLLGALMVGVPIWLHLIRHEQATRIPFSSLMFLRRIPIKSVSRQRLKYLVLLSLRLLVILLIVLAFARPYLPGGNRLLVAAGQGKHVVILLDTSMSMQYGDRWARALQAAREAIADLKERDRAQIVTFSSDFQTQNLATSDRAALLAVLESGIQPTASTTSYAQAFQAVERIGEEAQQPLSVVLISDLQKTGVGESGSGLGLAGVQQFRIVEAASEDSPNGTVAGVRSRRTVYQDRYPDRLLAQVRSFSSEESTREVELVLGGRLLQKKQVQVPASGISTVAFEGFDVPLGSNRGEVRLSPPDGLPLDDSFHFVLERHPPYQVLFVREATEGAELYYLRNALAAEPDSPFVVLPRNSAEAPNVSLDDYALVVLSNVAAVPPSFASKLRQFVQAGGGLLITLGNRFPNAAAEQQLGELLPAKAVERRWLSRNEERLVLLGEFDRDHPIFRELREAGTESLRSVQTYAYIRLQPSGRVLMKFANGDPALVETQYGSGRAVVVAFSWDNVWSDFPLHPAFIPVAHQLVRYTAQIAAEPPAFTIPTLVSLRDSGAGREARVWDVIGPEGKREVPLAEELRPDTLRLRRPGFYEIRSEGTTRLIAANPDPQESDLRRLSPEDRALWESFSPQNPELAGEAARFELAKRRVIWWNLLMVALFLAGAEALLANQYLRTRSGTAVGENPQENSYVG